MVTSYNRKRRVGIRKSKNKRLRYRRLVSIGEITKGIINELYSPIDATNRFINLALQSIGENPQGRQFLLESKEGIRKTSLLLKKLNNYAKKIEEEIRSIPDVAGDARAEKSRKKTEYINPKNPQAGV